MRERLMELIKEMEKHPEITCPKPGDVEACKTCKYAIGEFMCDSVARKVDYFLANGVIVPPCKVGDTVYYLTTVDTEKELNATDIFYGTVKSIAFDEKVVWISVKYTNGLYYCHKSNDFGKTVFLSLEEAEKALAERSGG